MSRFLRELIFSFLFKKVKLVCVCLIIECSRVQVSDSYVHSTKHQFLEKTSKVRKYGLVIRSQFAYDSLTQ